MGSLDRILETMVYTSRFHLHGVNFSEKDFNSLVKNKPSPREILKVANTEQKAVLIDLWGYDYLFEALPGKKILEEVKTFQNGDKKRPLNYVLFEYDFNTNTLQRCISVEWWENDKKTKKDTHRRTVLGVPIEKGTETVKGALAWTFNKKPMEYRLEWES